MSIHKLTAGSGYDYLTRQVAALDATDKGHTGLASYYAEKGETPGVWVGAGMTGIDGLDAGDVVTADHMQALFGAGHHPLAHARVKELDLRIGRPDVPRPTDADYKAAVRLGAPYKVYDNDVSAFRIEVAKRIAAINEADGLPGDWPVPAAQRAKIRTEVAAEFFRTEHGRDPADARELAATIAKHSRPKTTAVAGYDLTFSPVKSFSVLWALADPTMAAKLETAHNLAVKDALAFIEKRALFTREGSGGVRQVDVRGLLGAAFTHRDSRAGDPDLHTHVAVANKVQTLDGKWLAIDGRLMFKAVVAASEVYNTRLEAHARDQLGVQFTERPNPDTRKRPIREIVGVDPEVNARFSKRRISVEDRRQELATQFQRTHGRPPTPIETIQLAQRATLETRDAKHEPRSLVEQRAAWHTEAIGVFGGGSRGRQRLASMIRQALHPEPAAKKAADSAWFAQTAETITAAMEGRRATWQIWHVHAEAQRQVRAALAPGDIATEQIDVVVDLLVGEVLDGRSISLVRRAPVGDDELVEPVQPPELRRADGSSVYTVAGADLYTSARVLAAEQRLVDAAGRRDGYAVDETCVDLALLESAANGITLNAGQAALVRQMATSGARVQLAIAPAGSGKTTAMRALAQAWNEGGGTVIGLAPSAAAADALRSQIGSGTASQTDTLAKLVYTLTDPFGKAKPPTWVTNIGPESLVVIDEAGMADTLSLDIAVTHILDRGGSVRLIGDDQQLGAIGAGGVLRDIRATHGALHLSELVRFADSAEGAASLALREGKTEALGFYLDHDRVHVGDQATMAEDLFSSWQADRAKGLDSIMLAPTRDLVSQLNQQARAHRLQGADDPHRIGPVRRLADGNEASVGELIITRENDRKLRTSATDWVKNGDRWTVLGVDPGGDLTVQHTRHGRKVRLPSKYVASSVELGYACTINGAQGVTADTMHGLATGAESRQQLYTMLTRAAIANHLYLQTVGDGDPHSVIHPNLIHPLTPTDMIEAILARDEAPRSALSLLAEQSDPALRLGDATARYTDSLYVAAELELSPFDDAKQLASWSVGESVQISTPSVDSLLRERVVVSPDVVAVVDDADGSEVSFAGLDSRVNALAQVLVDRGVRVGDRVAVILPRSVDLVVTLAAAVRAGAAYVPVDPGYPADRVRTILGDADPALVVTDQSTAAAHPEVSGRAVVLVDDAGVQDLLEAGQAEPPALDRPITPDDAVYVIFTSGTTGRPKGVELSHRSVVNRLIWGRDALGLSKDSVAMFKSGLGFVDAATELFGPLTAGATVVVVSDDAARDPVALGVTIRRHQVTHLLTVPTLASALTDLPDASSALSSVRSWICSGEALTPTTAAEIMRAVPAALVRNFYGSTEITGDATATAVDSGGIVTIGGPVANTTVRVMDSWMRPTPVGVIGELYVGGVQVADGYARQAGRTAERFVADPFTDDGQRLYRTGDLVRWSSDGQLEYLGRVDDQVKIRGFRIEPDEIQSILEQYKTVSGAVVIPVDHPAGGKFLVAYVTATEDAPDDEDVLVDGLRGFAEERLPDYMVPAMFIRLNAIPTTPNGKLDRRALPTPDLGQAVGAGRAPETETEIALAEVFRDVLHLEDDVELCVDDDFFHLGGDSLLAARLVSSALARSLDISLRDVFTQRTIAALASFITTKPDGKILNDKPVLIPNSALLERLRESGDDPNSWVYTETFQVSSEITEASLQLIYSSLINQIDALRISVNARSRRIWVSQIQPVNSISTSIAEVENVDNKSGIPLCQAATELVDITSSRPSAVVYKRTRSCTYVALAIHAAAADRLSLHEIATALKLRIDGELFEFASSRLADALKSIDEAAKVVDVARADDWGKMLSLAETLDPAAFSREHIETVVWNGNHTDEEVRREIRRTLHAKIDIRRIGSVVDEEYLYPIGHYPNQCGPFTVTGPVNLGDPSYAGSHDYALLRHHSKSGRRALRHAPLPLVLVTRTYGLTEQVPEGLEKQYRAVIRYLIEPNRTTITILGLDPAVLGALTGAL